MSLFFGKHKPSVADKVRIAELEATIGSIIRSQAVIEFQLDGTIITANENFLRKMGYALPEIQGRHHSMFVRPDFADSPDYREFWRLLNSGQFLAGKFQRVGKDGADVWIQGAYHPLLNSAGKPYKITKFATEITSAEHQRIQADAKRTEAEDEQKAVVRVLADSLGRVADGDLTTRIEANLGSMYEQIKLDFNRAVDSLCEAAMAIAASTGGPTNRPDKSASASNDLLRRTELQAASLHETAIALHRAVRSLPALRLDAGADDVQGISPQKVKILTAANSNLLT